MNREFFELVLVLFPRPRFEETEDDYEGRGGGRESWELPGSCSLGSSEWNGSLPMNLVLPTRRADFSPLRPQTVDLLSGFTPTLKRDKSRVPSMPLVLDLVLSQAGALGDDALPHVPFS